MGMNVGKEFNDLRAEAGGPTGQVAALLVHDAVLRMCRAPAGRVAVVLHLSRLVPPAPRPYHVRIVRALLQDTAARNEGQVFTLGNGDMVLLCAVAPAPALMSIAGSVRPRASLAIDPATLPSILGRLLRADMRQAEEHVSVWRLDEAAAEFLAYTAASLREAAACLREADGVGRGGDDRPGGRYSKGRLMTMDEDFAGQTGLVDAMGQLMDQAGVIDLMRRQTAILVGGDVGHREASGGLRPMFQELTFSIAALEARLGEAGPGATGPIPGQAAADPFLFRHLVGRLDQRMLNFLLHEFGRGGPLDVMRGAAGQGAAMTPVLHLNLTIAAIMSPAFARFAVMCAHAGLRIGVEISVIEATIDLALFAKAKAVLAEHELTLVLDGVSHVSMMIARPWALRPDLLKLDWSPRLPDLVDPDRAAVDAAIAEIDPSRIILHKAETEAALRWGVARGIRRFQGRHVDAMLGASRVVACPRADACTLRQCVERSAAIGPAGRAGCYNLRLLDAGVAEAALAGEIA
jgi:hypothetical protein